MLQHATQEKKNLKKPNDSEFTVKLIFQQQAYCWSFTKIKLEEGKLLQTQCQTVSVYSRDGHNCDPPGV